MTLNEQRWDAYFSVHRDEIRSWVEKWAPAYLRAFDEADDRNARYSALSEAWWAAPDISNIREGGFFALTRLLSGEIN